MNGAWKYLVRDVAGLLDQVIVWCCIAIIALILTRCIN